MTVGCGGKSETIPTTTSLQASAAMVERGKPVSFTAYVSPVRGTSVPSGSVTFYENGVTVGSASLTKGQAVFTPTSLTIGRHSLTAVYSGDSKYGVSSSAPATTDITFTTTIPISAKDASGNRSTVSVPVTVQ
jgi:hypothetical protein